MFREPSSTSIIDYEILESQIESNFISSLNDKIDSLLDDSNKTSASDRLVGQIIKGEQLNLKRDIKIFDKVHKLGEIMAEHYTNKFFQNQDVPNIYTAAKCVDLWSVHQFSGDYNPLHNHIAEKKGLSFILWTKVPEKMRNEKACDLYNNSGKDHGCITFIGNTSGNLYDFRPRGVRVFVPKPGYLLMFPNWLNHMVNPFFCDGERRTIAGNISLFTSNEENKDNLDFKINHFGLGNPLKWKVCQDF